VGKLAEISVHLDKQKGILETTFPCNMQHAKLFHVTFHAIDNQAYKNQENIY